MRIGTVWRRPEIVDANGDKNDGAAKSDCAANRACHQRNRDEDQPMSAGYPLIADVLSAFDEPIQVSWATSGLIGHEHRADPDEANAEPVSEG